MKVIFLDIDGVLNYTRWYNDDRNPGNLNGQEGDLDPLCIKRVIKICEETGAKVVISSDWKLSWEGTQMRLTWMGLTDKYVIGKTPDYVILQYKHQYKFDWLKDSTYLEVDFYLPKYNIVIECQGLQHFKASDFGSKKSSKEKMFEYVIKHDNIKLNECNKHNIDILYFSNLGIDYPYYVYENKTELINAILKHKRNEI